jgi:serine/threonine protein kinase
MGSYLFKSVLGRGSFGEVYKISTRQTDREDCFAIKFCATEESTKKDYGLTEVTKLEDAQEEVAKMKYIESEFVIRVLASREILDRGLFWSCSELCSGGELDGRLKPQAVRGTRGIVAEPNAWRWMTECVLGLAHMHDALMMHNDLKPEVVIPPFPNAFVVFDSHYQQNSLSVFPCGCAEHLPHV